MTTLETITLTTAIIGATCGISGTVLGIINTWHQVSRNRVRLKVIPKLGYMLRNNTVITGVKADELQQRFAEQGAPALWCIEVINLSAFAVTVSSVGFGRENAPLRLFIFEPGTDSGQKWPTRLESREAVTLYAKVGQALNLDIVQEPVAYAKTDCGVVRYGTSPILKEYVARMEKRRDIGEQP